MVRQGKHTRRVSPLRKAKWKARGRFRWFWRKSFWQKVGIIAIPIIIFLITVPLLTYIYFARDISDKDRLMNRNNTGIVLYANDGTTEIYSSGRAAHRDLVPLTQISDNMKHALVASEDKNFYSHSGFSVGNTLAALYTDVLSGSTSYGGSTLTQQLAKNTLLSDNKNFLRKFQELSIAIAIERTYSKDDILAMYLNSVYYGENAFGIQDAAKTYFGDSVTPAQLDLAQSAMLVGVLPAPSAYSPISGNPKYAKQRQTTVLTRMVTNGYITEAQKQAALAEPLTYAPARSPADSSPAPHFAQMVMQELYDKYGEETVTRSGYQVKTTLDLNLQKQMQANISSRMKYINANGGSNASGVAIDPTTGEVRALVGSADWNNTEWGKVNMVTTPRQPGSSFKPIYYSEALAKGVITPATIFADEPTDFGGGYKPQNASRTYSGNVSVRNALSRSLNIPSVKVMQKLGIDNSVSAAQRMGITTLKASSQYGLSLALGSAEVPLIEMVNTYAGFAGAGQQYPTSDIKEIDSKYNEKVFVANNKSKNVISPEGAYLISNILSDNGARAPIFGNTLTVPGKTVAVKTGTTDDSRDAWTIGYTSQLVVGFWVGNNDNTPMRNGGSTMAGPIWVATMKYALANSNPSFTAPSGVTQRYVCSSNGALADGPGSGVYQEYFLSTALPTDSCSVKQPDSQQNQPQPQPNPQSNTSSSPTATTTSLAASPSSSATLGATVTLTAEVSQSATGFMTFKDGSTTIGTAGVQDGKATMSTNILLPGSHSLSAVFTPYDTNSYNTSTSQTIFYTITTGQGNGSGNGNGNNGNASGNPFN